MPEISLNCKVCHEVKFELFALWVECSAKVTYDSQNLDPDAEEVAVQTCNL